MAPHTVTFNLDNENAINRNDNGNDSISFSNQHHNNNNDGNRSSNVSGTNNSNHTSKSTPHIPQPSTTDVINTSNNNMITPSQTLANLLNDDTRLETFGLTRLDNSGNNRDNDIGSNSGESQNNINKNMTTTSSKANNEAASFAYAAALLTPTSSSNMENTAINETEIRDRARLALAEVDRKLTLIISLAERVSRERPEDVAGPLLKLHGFGLNLENHSGNNMVQQEEDKCGDGVDDDEDEDEEGIIVDGDNSQAKTKVAKNQVKTQTVSPPTTYTLATTQTKCQRLSRQASILADVASRATSALERNHHRAVRASSKLERVLQISDCLKRAMRLRFEGRKWGDYGTNSNGINTNMGLTTTDDPRLLARAASGASTMMSLLKDHDDEFPSEEHGFIQVVEQCRPNTHRVAKAVRDAAGSLLLLDSSCKSSSASSGITKTTANTTKGIIDTTRLAATLQVYFHLGELPNATWDFVERRGLNVANEAGKDLWGSHGLDVLLNDMEQYNDDVNKIRTSGEGGNSSGLKVNQTLLEKRATRSRQWANHGFLSAAKAVWNLQKILTRKSDALTRSKFLNVVNASPIPTKFKEAEMILNERAARRKGSSGGGGKLSKNNEITIARPSLFALFWNQYCLELGTQVSELIRVAKEEVEGEQDEDGGIMIVAALYPSVRAAALDALGVLRDLVRAGGADGGSLESGGGWGSSGSNTITNSNSGDGGGIDHHFSSSSPGILGGISSDVPSDIPADTWTLPDSGTMIPVISTPVPPSALFPSTTAYMEASGVLATGKKATAASSSSKNNNHGPSAARLSDALSSPEWLALSGEGFGFHTSGRKNVGAGLGPLRDVFAQASRKRLMSPLIGLFAKRYPNADGAAAATIDEGGISIMTSDVVSTSSKNGGGGIGGEKDDESQHWPVILPSKSDLEAIVKVAREELALADPRKGGGEQSLATMVGEGVVDMVDRFCEMASGATSDGGDGVSGGGNTGAGGEGDDEIELLTEDGRPTAALGHDIRLASVLGSLSQSLRELPERTFVDPYRPSHSLRHEEAASACRVALLPALHEVDSIVQHGIVDRLCRALNRRTARVMAAMHQGAYLESSHTVSDLAEGDADSNKSFVRNRLVGMYESIATEILTRLPSDYKPGVVSSVCAHSMRCFASHASLIRPLGEDGRMRLVRDLADLELALGTLSSSTGPDWIPIEKTAPHLELRALRRALFWTGMEDHSDDGPERVARMMLRETWAGEIRPSVAMGLLFARAPAQLTSPHRLDRGEVSNDGGVTAAAMSYVDGMVGLDGSIDDGEARAWLATVSCCDAYRQRAAAGRINREEQKNERNDNKSSDERVAEILSIVGPELLRRRRL